MYHSFRCYTWGMCLSMFILLMGQGMAVHAQKNETIRRLEGEHTSLREQINKSQSLLTETEKAVGHELADLQALEAQLLERKKYVARIESDMRAVDKEVRAVTKKIAELEKQLKARKDEYAYSVRYLRKQSTVHQRLIFIFSADNFNQMIRRMRYIVEYADYQKQQVTAILEKKEEIEQKKAELQEVKAAKVTLKKKVEEEKLKLQEAQKKQEVMVAKLKRKKRSIQKQLKEQQSREKALNKRIEEEIDREIRRLAKLEEMRKARERERAKKAKGKKKSTKPEAKPRRSEPVIHKKMKTYSTDREVGVAFVQNKRQLPYPIVGSYAYLSHFNKAKMQHGIKIYGKAPCHARAVFQGVVSVVFQVPSGARGIIIRHGNYRTVYANLKTPTVREGEKVKQGQDLGEIYADPLYNNRPTLLFEVRKGREALNPDSWLKR